ncbi:SAM-dependent methyltransferase [Pontibaca methylaminivorans]|uniref:Cyclopropane-fatty-acyl-phospholipid synthase n=1 Tax=Pontibaca methylaminivorans TaxID=515897 RepID=A0A1R3WWP9_9RHOB|nr:cyclopropane-fatty-acyl-phospholipid synthase family protein [Pontibaca methylaminivorans]SIT81243.1 cyclopropane-fatty-acyl-phospholipid synthase [Pontibaca methylaminivorans]
MWQTVFDKMASRLIRSGRLEVTMPDGSRRDYGPGGGYESDIAVRDDATLRALCMNPELALGEGYMDGRIVIEGDDLDTLLRLLMSNLSTDFAPLWVRAVEWGRYVLRGPLMRNTRKSARANVAHHYDISDDLYRLFLDEDMQYSCAYFETPETGLAEAQAAKKAHIARKLQIEPGMRVLDIGCGWGGMALTLARDFGAHVTGVTLSKNQLATAKARAREAGLEDQLDFRLQDYRELSESFDRIVSVGMLEHVGAPHYAEYFNQVGKLLTADGVALIHTIGRNAPPDVPSPWIDKYIFPGGYIPSLSELAVPVENAGLWYLDIEILRLHYAMTLRHWLERFDARIEDVRKMYDERFIRMWRFYLIACIVTFEVGRLGVFQLQIGQERNVVPLTRDYLYRDRTIPAAREAAE